MIHESYNHLRIVVPHPKKTWLIVSLVLMVVALGAVFGYGKLYRPGPKSPGITTPKAQFHLAGEPDKKFTTIKIKAFYFVPQDAAAEPADLWHKQLTDGLQQTAKFYQLQLDNSTTINWEIYPEAVVGQQPGAFYDGTDTGQGNPHALISVRQELLQRFFQQPQNPSDAAFAQTAAEEYPVIGILYEGLGSSATLITDQTAATGGLDSVTLEGNQPQAFLVSRYFFTSDSYKDYYLSIFAHEFGHILGLADAFNLQNGQVQDDDIMGSGRFRPLAATYLSLANKKLLGLTY